MQRVLYQSQSPKKSLDGVAIVSAIVAADDPKASAEKLAGLIRNPPRFAQALNPPRANESEALLDEVPQIIRKMVEVHPLVHNMINFVVSNFVANVALSMSVYCTWPAIFHANRSTVVHLPSCLHMAMKPPTCASLMVLF